MRVYGLPEIHAKTVKQINSNSNDFKWFFYQITNDEIAFGEKSTDNRNACIQLKSLGNIFSIPNITNDEIAKILKNK